jgi:hypothetical protein
MECLRNKKAKKGAQFARNFVFLGNQIAPNRTENENFVASGSSSNRQGGERMVFIEAESVS